MQAAGSYLSNAAYLFILILVKQGGYVQAQFFRGAEDGPGSARYNKIPLRKPENPIEACPPGAEL
jgi:hypothetical protein